MSIISKHMLVRHSIKDSTALNYSKPLGFDWKHPFAVVFNLVIKFLHFNVHHRSDFH